MSEVKRLDKYDVMRSEGGLRWVPEEAYDNLATENAALRAEVERWKADAANENAKANRLFAELEEVRADLDGFINSQ